MGCRSRAGPLPASIPTLRPGLAGELTSSAPGAGTRARYFALPSSGRRRETCPSSSGSQTFDEALVAGDTAAAADLFADDGYWRDLVAFTWNIKTVEGPAGVQDMLDATLTMCSLDGWRSASRPARPTV